MMTGRRISSVLVIAALFLTGFGIARMVGSMSESAGSAYTSSNMASLDHTLEGVDLVVRGTVVDLGETVTKPSGANHLAATIEVKEVLWVASTPSQRRLIAEYGEVPAVGAGTLEIYEPLPAEGREVSALQAATDEKDLVFTLGYWDPSLYSDAVAEFGLIHVMSTPANEKPIQFFGVATDNHVEHLIPVAAAASGRSDLTAVSPELIDALVSWIDEKAALRLAPETSDYGPLQSAYREYRGFDVSPMDRWADLAPEDRYIDPETVPAEIAGTLIESTAFIEVARDAEVEGWYLVLETPTGVVHRAHLRGGTHPAALWLTGEEQVEVYITMPERAFRRHIGAFTPPPISADGPVDVIYVTSDVLTLDTAPMQLHHEALDAEDFEAAIERWQADLATRNPPEVSEPETETS